MTAVVISQPMYFPWRGMLEQIALADVFVFYDDVQLPYGGGATRGFQTRVQVKNATGWQWVSIPVARVTKETLISEAKITPGPWRRKHLAAFDASYRRAPHYAEVRAEVIEPVLALETDSLSDVCMASMRKVMAYVGLTPPVHVSSELGIGGVDASARVLAHCERFGATDYISGHGAKRYLDHGLFDRAGVRVRYMEYANVPYEQLYGDFLPYVSSIDLLSNVGRDRSRALLTSPAVYWRDLGDVPERPDDEAAAT